MRISDWSSDVCSSDLIMSSGERSDGLHAPVFRFDTDEPWRLVQPFLDANAPREILAKVAGRQAAGADQRRCVPTGKQNQPVPWMRGRSHPQIGRAHV